MKRYLSDGTEAAIIQTTPNLYKVKYLVRDKKKVGWVKRENLFFYPPLAERTPTVFYTPLKTGEAYDLNV